MRKILFLAAILLLAPAVSQAKTLEELLVEKGVITKGEGHAASDSGPGKVSYSDHGTRMDFASGFTTGFNVYALETYTYTDNDEDSGASNTSSFDVEKARIYMWGTALNQEFSYLINGDFAATDASADGSTAALQDAWVKWHACDTGWVRMGQFKTAVSRQFNNADHKQQFVHRTLVSDYFDLGRQNGLDSSWSFADGQFTLGAGIFNGSSAGEGQNLPGTDTKHTGVVNVRWNAMGTMDSYSEGDAEWTEDPALSIGAAYAYGDTAENVTTDSVSVDANFKYMGWGLHAELFNEVVDADDGSEKYEPTGFYAQLGYFLEPKTIEAAVGYSYLDCDDGDKTSDSVCAGNDNVNEVKVGVNYLWSGHNLKAQLNYVLRNTDTAGADGDDINTNFWILGVTQYL